MSATTLGCARAGAPGASTPGPGPTRGGGGPRSAELRGPWFFRRSPGGEEALPPEASRATDWMPATVPGCVHTDLLANGRIGDPFVGLNERGVQWIGETGWEYRTAFEADDALLSRGHVELVWKGIDTYADVLLNGAVVLRANNMFREWRVDVKPHLRKGPNELVVLFRSPIAEGKARYDGLGYVLPAANDQGTPMVSMFTRKAPYHYGWDWGPRLVTSGVWRPVFLEAWDDARIEDLQVFQEELTDARATLRVRAAVVASRASRAELAVSVAKRASSGDPETTSPGTRGADAPGGTAAVTLSPGRNTIELRVVIEKPARWWPNGLGRPTLYAVDAALSVEGAPRGTRRARIGLRTLEVIHRPDAQGKSFTVSVNGAPVFMKGANYIPSDSFPSRVTSGRYRRLVESAAQANMNMLRVWGGGVYEDDRFYDLCDELGILVWQDFMFACSMYPGDDAFVENVREEAVDNVRRLRNHPCLALWAGNNEIEAAWLKWGWQRKFDLSEEAQRTIWRDYRRLFHEVLPGVVAEEDPGRFYTRSSPSANDDAVPPDTIGYGDMHYWGVWHAEEPYTKYADHVSRFMSEYGFQSFPELSTVARYAAPADYRIDSPVMLAHQRHPRGNQLIRTYMDRDFRTPKDFASFLYVSQLLQAIIIQYAAEAHRRRMPYNAGSLYWQLDDCWPVASWSGIDYFGRWKALHYFARRFFAPVLVSTTEEEGAVLVHVVSDRRDEAELRLALRVVDFDGREIWRKESSARVLPNASAVHFAAPRAELLGGSPADRVVFVAEAFEGARRLGRSLHYFTKAKDLSLEDPGLRVQVTPAEDRRVTLSVSARRLARAVCLSGSAADTGGGAPSDNYFDLLPGEAVAVAWTGPPSDGYRAFSLRDTY